MYYKVHGQNNNGQSNESWIELSATAGNSLVEDHGNVESSNEIGNVQNCEEVAILVNRDVP